MNRCVDHLGQTSINKYCHAEITIANSNGEITIVNKNREWTIVNDNGEMTFVNNNGEITIANDATWYAEFVVLFTY